jgi:hypothetical protein
MNIESTRCDRRRTTSLHHLAGLSLAVPLILVDGSHAPEYGIFGSFFPVWIFCSVGGFLRTAGVRALITRTAIAEHLAAPEVTDNQRVKQGDLRSRDFANQFGICARRWQSGIRFVMLLVELLACAQPIC